MIEMSQLCAWDNLMRAWQKAARGKRGGAAVAQFEHRLADNLLALQARLRDGSYRPGPYVTFSIHEPKKRVIGAAPFVDRVVHHALCNLMEPALEQQFFADSFANRKGKGTHRAVDRFQALASQHRFVLRLDIVKHFANIDHQILLRQLKPLLHDGDVAALVSLILAGGETASEQVAASYFAGDDLFAALRPRGLPIGNLTSQLWSNRYLHSLDAFVRRQLRCGAYLRYADDFALFSDNKDDLHHWKLRVEEHLMGLRLMCHGHSARLQRVVDGAPWLGFVVFPQHRLLKSRCVVRSTRALNAAYGQWKSGAESFSFFDARVQGWINHAAVGDTWGLRRHRLGEFDLRNSPS